MADTLWWLSWWEASDDWRPMGPEWPPPLPIVAYWSTGCDGPRTSVVALVCAADEQAAWAAVRAPHCWPTESERRFSRQIVGPPSDRFPCPEWAVDRWPWSVPRG